MISQKLHENVYYYTDVIEDVENLVKQINESEFSEGIYKVIPEWNEWSACSGQMYVYGQKKNLFPEYMEELSEDNKIKAQYIIDTITKAFLDVCEDYKKQNNINDDVNLSHFIGINKYMHGTYMGTHYDQQEGDSRLKYSLVLYLNDDYDGGEISFNIKEGVLTSTDDAAKAEFPVDSEHNKKVIDFYIKPKAGSCIIFPSSPPYSHTAHIVKTNWKYMVPGFWMEKDNV